MSKEDFVTDVVEALLILSLHFEDYTINTLAEELVKKSFYTVSHKEDIELTKEIMRELNEAIYNDNN